MPRLQNKIAFITGAASGIGKSIATLFIKEGAKVVISDVCDDKGMETAKELNCEYIHLDVSKEDEWDKTLKSVFDKYGNLNVVVNTFKLEIGTFNK